MLGNLNVYRLMNTNFINSRDVTHAILPKSQCWCIDGNSVFILRIRVNAYYRIELPFETDEDIRLAGELKEVFKGILRFERTACPFKRGFEVEHPEPADILIRSKRWKNTERARRWTIDKYWRPEDEPDFVPAGAKRMAQLPENYNFGERRRFHGQVREKSIDGVDSQPVLADDATEFSIGDYLQKSRSLQRRPVTNSPFLSRRTRSVTPPPVPKGKILSEKRPTFRNKSKDQRPSSMYVMPTFTFVYDMREDDIRSQPITDLFGTTDRNEINSSNDKSTDPKPFVDNFPRPETEKEASLPQTPTRDAYNHQEYKNNLLVSSESPTSEQESERGRSPLATPPLLNDTEEGFSPTWTEEIITPPDTLRQRQKAVARPSIHNMSDKADKAFPEDCAFSSARGPAPKAEEAMAPEVDYEAAKVSEATEGTEAEPDIPNTSKTAIISETIKFEQEPEPEQTQEPLESAQPTEAVDTETGTEPKKARGPPKTPDRPIKASSTDTASAISTKTIPSVTDTPLLSPSMNLSPMHLIRRAYVILVSPPDHIFSLMYRIATRLAASGFAKEGLAGQRSGGTGYGEGRVRKRRSMLEGGSEMWEEGEEGIEWSDDDEDQEYYDGFDDQNDDEDDIYEEKRVGGGGPNIGGDGGDASDAEFEKEDDVQLLVRDDNNDEEEEGKTRKAGKESTDKKTNDSWSSDVD